MKHRAGTYARWSYALAATLTLMGCGNGSSTAPAAGNDPGPVGNNPPPPVAIQGVATPSTVSVVTATNAN